MLTLVVDVEVINEFGVLLQGVRGGEANFKVRRKERKLQDGCVVALA
jgi:hypothetical protein